MQINVLPLSHIAFPYLHVAAAKSCLKTGRSSISVNKTSFRNKNIFLQKFTQEIHFFSASVMAAPAALAYSKLFYPETRQSKTTIKNIKLDKGEQANVLDAAAQVRQGKLVL